jgi:outer membrane protein assembly factor BamB
VRLCSREVRMSSRSGARTVITNGRGYFFLAAGLALFVPQGQAAAPPRPAARPRIVKKVPLPAPVDVLDPATRHAYLYNSWETKPFVGAYSLHSRRFLWKTTIQPVFSGNRELSVGVGPFAITRSLVLCAGPVAESHWPPLLALDRATGKVRWQEPPAVYERDPAPAAATVQGERVYQVTGRSLRCVSVPTGKTLWRTVFGKWSPLYNAPHPPAVSGGAVYTQLQGDGHSYLFKVDARDGRILWREGVPWMTSRQPRAEEYSPVAATAEVVLTILPVGPLRPDPENLLSPYPPPFALQCRRSRDGKLLWQRGVEGPTRAEPILITHGRALLNDGHRIRAYALESGALVWGRESEWYRAWTLTPGGLVTAVYYAAGDSELVALHPDTGETKWVLPLRRSLLWSIYPGAASREVLVVETQPGEAPPNLLVIRTPP